MSLLGKESLHRFLEKVIGAFEKEDSFGLREIANQAIEEAALGNNRQLAEIAMISYCLHKMHSKQHVVRDKSWGNIKKGIFSGLKKAEKSIIAGELEAFDKDIEAVIASVRATDKKMGHYAQNLFEKARVKYASSAYSLGLGLGQAASLTGAEKKDLLRYIGITKIADREVEKTGIGDRLRKLKKVMGAEKK